MNETIKTIVELTAKAAQTTCTGLWSDKLKDKLDRERADQAMRQLYVREDGQQLFSMPEQQNVSVR